MHNDLILADANLNMIHMKKRITGTLFLIIMICSHLSAHSGKSKYHVIIDTDGALDDMRALSMFLSGNDIRVLAITCSQGTFPSHSVKCFI